jgi:hypothetical protein
VKLAFTSAAYYPAESRHTWMLRESTKRLGIDLRLYGVGEQYTGWAQAKYHGLMVMLDQLKSEGYTHVLYTDGVDSFFREEQEDITVIYNNFYRAPALLLSGEENCWPDDKYRTCFFTNEPYSARYPCAGQFMGEISYIQEKWPLLAQYEPELGPNDQAWIHRGVAEGILTEWRVDTSSFIFQNMNGNVTELLWGSVLHFSGGYNDPETGKEERMMPTWKAVWGDK